MSQSAGTEPRAAPDQPASAEPSRSRVVRLAQVLFLRLGVLPFLLAIAVVVFTALSRNFLTTENLVNVVRQSVYLMIVSLGQMLALLTGGFDLSVGTIVALTSVVGATAMAGVTAASPDSVWLAVALGCLAGIAAGTLVGVCQRHRRGGVQRLALHHDAGDRFGRVRHRAVHDRRGAGVRDAAGSSARCSASAASPASRSRCSSRWSSPHSPGCW